MNAKRLLAVLLAAGAAAAVPAAAAPSRASAARHETKTAEAEFRAKARKDLDALDARIAKLEKGAKEAEGGTKTRLEADAKALRAKKSEADRMLGKFETESARARKELEAKLDRSVRELKAAVRKEEARARGGSGGPGR